MEVPVRTTPEQAQEGVAQAAVGRRMSRVEKEAESVQGVWRGEHLPAQTEKEHVQRLRRGEYLPAQSEKEPLQGVRRGEHLPAQSEKQHEHDVQSRHGRPDAAGS